MNAAEKLERFQQVLLNSPEYLLLADGERAACKRLLALAAAETPDADAFEETYTAAVVEARSLVARGQLTGIDLSYLEL